MKAAKAILSEKGQITVPKPVRDSLGLKPGQVIEFEVKNGVLVGRKKVATDSIEGVVGILRGRILDVDEYLNETRGEGLRGRRSR